MKNVFVPKEETKLRLLAILKDAGKPLKPTEWAEKAKLNRVTVYRYIEQLKSEGWLNVKPGPGRAMLYSVKANRAVLPVDQIPQDTKPTNLKMEKKELQEMLPKLLGGASDRPQITASMFMAQEFFKTIAGLYREVAHAQSGEMPSKDALAKYREQIYTAKQKYEGFLTIFNTMLLTPELWDPRAISSYLSGNFDLIQLAQWVTDAEDNADLVLHILRSLNSQSDYTVTDSSITFDLSS